eukprot:7085063-Lingulodinium_polyedra.AAC.1
MKAAPAEAAVALHLVQLKAVARVEEPLQWRGNIVMELYKGAGDRAECASHRDIALGDVAGK